MANWREIENQKMKQATAAKNASTAKTSNADRYAAERAATQTGTVRTAGVSSGRNNTARRSSSSSGSSGGSSGSSVRSDSREQEERRRAQEAQQEAMRVQAERDAYASLMKTKYNPAGTAGIEKNPDTGVGTTGGANAVGMSSANPASVYAQFLALGESEPGKAETTLNAGGGSLAGIYASDSWNTPGDEIVLDIYGNYLKNSVLQELKGKGYYDNWQEKAHSLDGTDKTYGWQYAIDPSGYEGTLGAGVGTDSGGVSGMGWMDKNPYTGAGDSILEAQDAATAAAVQAYRNQLPLVNESYDNLARQAYAAYMKSRTGLPEQTAGMATGMADSLMTQNDLNYQNNLSSNELARAAALADVRTQAAQIQAQGELQRAQTQADLEQQAYQRMVELMQMQWEQEQQERKAASKTTTTTYKPRLTLDQAKAAYDGGIRTQEVMEAMNYYYGAGWNASGERPPVAGSSIIGALPTGSSQAAMLQKYF